MKTATRNLQKMLLLAGLLGGGFVSTTCAQDRPAGNGSLLRTWMKRNQDAKKIESEAAGVIPKLDVPYLNDNESAHKLDVYCPPKKETPLPVLVHIHGGGWEIGDKKLMRSTGLFYASQGVLFITPNYRLSPKAKHPAHTEDCAAAVAWAFAHAAELGGDRSRIFVSGHSAGAHLAALLGTAPSYLQKYKINPWELAGVIPVDAASFDLADEGNERLVKKFIGDSFGADSRVLRSASPFHHVLINARYPGFLVLNTTNRETAAEGARKFADKLKSVGCNVRFVPVGNHTHGEMASGMHDTSDPVGSAIFNFISPEAKK